VLFVQKGVGNFLFTNFAEDFSVRFGMAEEIADPWVAGVRPLIEG
tara:strand:+ start:264 stop:398 length:135 start_codon:yes stop_codon:yes gene_type:complete